jgi:ABC-type enterobactin transport system permease subunit
VDEERFNRHQEAVGQAEASLVKLVSTGRTPTLRNAGVLSGETWCASQLWSIAFTLMRISLGNTRLSRPSKAANLGTEFAAVLAAAVERVKAIIAPEQPQLSLA